MRRLEDVKADFDEARRMYRRVDRIFFADGDALMCRAEHMAELLQYIHRLFPECERVTSYGSPASILVKTQEELDQLHGLGLEMVYMGLESGSDEVLRRVNKGETVDEIVRAGLMVKKAGMKLSVTCIAGLGSLELSEEHAVGTALALSRMKQHVQVYTDNRQGWTDAINNAVQKGTAHDVLEPKPDREVMNAQRLFSTARELRDVAAGRAVLRQAGLAGGDSPARFIAPGRKYPQPYVALPAFDRNGKSAGIWLNPLTTDDGNGLRGFSGEGRVKGSGDAQFAGLQGSRNGREPAG